MLRKGFAALMMGVICASGVSADDAGQGQNSAQRPGIIGWFKHKPKTSSAAAAPTAIILAVVEDAERQAAQVQVRQTASNQDDQLTGPNEIVAA